MGDGIQTIFRIKLKLCHLIFGKGFVPNEYDLALSKLDFEFKASLLLDAIVLV